MDNAAGLATYTSNQRDLFITDSILTSVREQSKGTNIDTVYLAGIMQDDDSLPFTLATEGLMSTSAAQCGVYNCQPKRFHDVVRMLQPPSATEYLHIKTSKKIAKALMKIQAYNPGKLRKQFKNALPWPSSKSTVIDINSGTAFIFLDRKSIKLFNEQILALDPKALKAPNSKDRAQR
jgi:hypothetical protein